MDLWTYWIYYSFGYVPATYECYKKNNDHDVHTRTYFVHALSVSECVCAYHNMQYRAAVSLAPYRSMSKIKINCRTKVTNRTGPTNRRQLLEPYNTHVHAPYDDGIVIHRIIFFFFSFKVCAFNNVVLTVYRIKPTTSKVKGFFFYTQSESTNFVYDYLILLPIAFFFQYTNN